jgi:hypothetical protein
MSFVNAFPANVSKFSYVGMLVRPPGPPVTFAICNATVRYVAWGDVIDPDNHKGVINTFLCVSQGIAVWAKIVAKGAGVLQ